MKDTDIKILEDCGWEVNCESPFEISLIDDPSSQASGFAAELILRYSKDENGH